MDVYVTRRENRDRLLSEVIGDNIIKTEAGKPYVEDSNVFFSISHTEDTLVVAVTDKGNIGIDIEPAARKRDVHFDRVAKRIFTEKEIEYATDLARFTEVWTRKEACVKCIGTGIAMDFKNFTVVENDELVSPVSMPAGAYNQVKLHIIPAKIDGFVCNIACTEPEEIKLTNY